VLQAIEAKIAGQPCAIPAESHVALESLLLFSADDLVVGSETDDDGESYETYRFVTTAAQARRQVRSRRQSSRQDAR